MKLIVSTLSIFTAALLGAASAHAEDLNEIFRRVNELVAAKNYTKAINELSWANKEIEQMHQEQLKAYFPDALEGFSGGEVESNGAMGFTETSRTYTKGDEQLKVSLTGGTSMGGQAGLGGIAALGQMAAMMGGQTGQKTFRISGRTATLEKRSGGADLTVFLESGSILKLDLDGATAPESLKKMAEAMKLDELDKYLKG